MLVSIAKWAAAVAVLLAAMSWRLSPEFELLLDLVFCVIVGIVAFRAIRAMEYVWAAGFIATALMLNPAVPFFAPAGNLAALMALFFIAPLAIASVALRVHPALCLPSLNGNDEFVPV